LAANQKIGHDKSAWQLARDAACLVQLGRVEEARRVAAEVLRKKPTFSVESEMPRYKYGAGLPE
jgi:adenylate cyclase